MGHNDIVSSVLCQYRTRDITLSDVATQFGCTYSKAGLRARSAQQREVRGSNHEHCFRRVTINKCVNTYCSKRAGTQRPLVKKVKSGIRSHSVENVSLSLLSLWIGTHRSAPKLHKPVQATSVKWLVQTSDQFEHTIDAPNSPSNHRKVRNLRNQKSSSNLNGRRFVKIAEKINKVLSLTTTRDKKQNAWKEGILE